jgi:hypothetical protein
MKTLKQFEKNNNDCLLPQRAWNAYEKIIKAIAEGEESDASTDDFDFLRSIHFIDSTLDKGLTELGAAYFDSKFIRSELDGANNELRKGLLQFPPCEALLQLLSGVKTPKKNNALSILKSRGFWFYTDESPLTSLLLMMNSVGLISYSKRFKTIEILYNPTSKNTEVPPSIFIDPTRPYGNKTWLKRVLLSCKNHIYWLDKHFTAAGLEFLWETADANKIKNIKILSLGLDVHVTPKVIKDYKDLKKEFANKGISLEWLRINSSLIRDTHDRWILGDKMAWNLPDVNTIMSGSRSEINKSSSHEEMKVAFLDYLKQAKEISS